MRVGKGAQDHGPDRTDVRGAPDPGRRLEEAGLGRLARHLRQRPFYKSKTWDDLESGLRASGLPQEAKRELFNRWDAVAEYLGLEERLAPERDTSFSIDYLEHLHIKLFTLTYWGKSSVSKE